MKDPCTSWVGKSVEATTQANTSIHRWRLYAGTN